MSNGYIFPNQTFSSIFRIRKISLNLQDNLERHLLQIYMGAKNDKYYRGFTTRYTNMTIKLRVLVEKTLRDYDKIYNDPNTPISIKDYVLVLADYAIKHLHKVEDLWDRINRARELVGW